MWGEAAVEEGVVGEELEGEDVVGGFAVVVVPGAEHALHLGAAGVADVPGGDDVGLGVECGGEGGAAGVEVAVMVGDGDFGAAGGAGYGGLGVERGHAAIEGVAVEIAAGEVAEGAVGEARGDGEVVLVGVRGVG